MNEEKNLLEKAERICLDASSRVESDYSDSVNSLISKMQWTIEYHKEKLNEAVEQLGHVLK